MKRMGLLATAAAVFFAANVVPREARAQHRSSSRVTGACRAIWVSVPDAPGRSKRARKRPSLEFSATEILDLELLVYLPSRSTLGGKNIELKVFTPKGHLYQTLKLSASSASSDDGGRAQRSRAQIVTATLPVAGTTIVNNSLYGKWKAEAYVEGETTPCTSPRSFTIEP